MVEYVMLVDHNDRPIGSAEKLYAHQKGLCHRAFSIFIIDARCSPQRLLLQKRHIDKYHSGGLWSNACCGHPRPREEISAAASRRLYEELGLVLPLQKVSVFHYRAQLEHGLVEDEIDHLFIGTYGGEALVPHRHEISDTQWVTFEALRQGLAQHPSRYSAWLGPALNELERVARVIFP